MKERITYLHNKSTGHVLAALRHRPKPEQAAEPEPDFTAVELARSGLLVRSNDFSSDNPSPLTTVITIDPQHLDTHSTLYLRATDLDVLRRPMGYLLDLEDEKKRQSLPDGQATSSPSIGIGGELDATEVTIRLTAAPAAEELRALVQAAQNAATLATDGTVETGVQTVATNAAQAATAAESFPATRTVSEAAGTVTGDAIQTATLTSGAANSVLAIMPPNTTAGGRLVDANAALAVAAVARNQNRLSAAADQVVSAVANLVSAMDALAGVTPPPSDMTNIDAVKAAAAAALGVASLTRTLLHIRDGVTAETPFWIQLEPAGGGAPVISPPDEILESGKYEATFRVSGLIPGATYRALVLVKGREPTFIPELVV